MINKKALLLGSAAALLVTGVQAADMPKAPAREPVYRCDITGFIELPGTDICFKIGGFARFLAGTATDNVTGLGPNSAYGWSDIGGNTIHTTDDTFVMHATARLNFDARTSTEYGIVRAFIEMQAEDNNASTGGPFELRHAFIQFGNWTFGKTDTLVAHGSSAPAYTDFIAHIGDPYGRSVQVRYTMPLGNGMTLAVALEDPAFGQAGEYTTNWAAAITAAGSPTVGGSAFVGERDEMPAILAALSFDGSWGSAQIAGGIRQNVYTAGGIADRDIGWRVDAGANINLTSAITLLARAYYADGFNAHSSIALGDVIKSALPGNFILDNVEEWMVMAGLSFAIMPDVTASISAAYAETEPGSTVGSQYFFTITPQHASVDVFQVVGNVFWTPVNNFELGVEVAYTDVGYNTAGPILGQIPAPVDTDAFSVAFQATRSF